jgi:hypothetical protein
MLPKGKTYNDFINYYPYLLSLKLGVINKKSIKSFRDAIGHEILNEKHKKKMLKNRKNKIAHYDENLDKVIGRNK